MTNKNPTIDEIHKIMESLKRHSDNKIIQRILDECFSNGDTD